MTSLADALAELGDAFAKVTAAAVAEGGLRAADDTELLSALGVAGRIRRTAEAVMVEAVAVIMDRDGAVGHGDRMTTRYGCRNTGERTPRRRRPRPPARSTAAGGRRAAAARVRQGAQSTGRRGAGPGPVLRRG